MDEAPQQRRLQDGIQPNITIYDVIDISVESDFYDDENEEIRVANYSLTRITEREMDIQVDFNMPERITQS